MLKIFFARDVIILTRAFFGLYGLIDLLIIYLLSLLAYYNCLFIVYCVSLSAMCAWVRSRPLCRGGGWACDYRVLYLLDYRLCVYSQEE